MKGVVEVVENAISVAGVHDVIPVRVSITVHGAPPVVDPTIVKFSGE